jgi:hypothetical protein
MNFIFNAPTPILWIAQPHIRLVPGSFLLGLRLSGFEFRGLLYANAELRDHVELSVISPILLLARCIIRRVTVLCVLK